MHHVSANLVVDWNTSTGRSNQPPLLAELIVAAIKTCVPQRRRVKAMVGGVTHEAVICVHPSLVACVRACACQVPGVGRSIALPFRAGAVRELVCVMWSLLVVGCLSALQLKTH